MKPHRIGLIAANTWDDVFQRSQAFATELALMGHTVFYVEPVTRCSRLAKFARLAKAFRPRQVSPGVFVLCPPFFLPSETNRRHLWMNHALTPILRALFSRLRLTTLIVQNPGFAAPVLSSKLPFVYDKVDDTHLFDGVLRDRVLKQTRRLQEASLFNSYIAPGSAKADPKGVFIPNGVYPDELFPVEIGKSFDGVTLASIASWVDLDALLDAKSHTVLIGPMLSESASTRYRLYLERGGRTCLWIPRVEKPMANLWLNASHVGLVPFREDHPITQYAVPMKILEYFLCNLPVVTYWNPSIEELFGPMVVFYGPHHESRSIDEAIGAARHQRNNYRSFAQGFAWGKIVAEFERRLCEAI
jgi:glycosyltransferase involved in cell wall biosynthesis